MKNIVQILTSSRFKSFYWRAGMMLIAVTTEFLAQNIGVFNLGAETTVTLGLVLGEVSKALNNRRKGKNALGKNNS